MKATIEPQQVRKVTIELTHEEAQKIISYIDKKGTYEGGPRATWSGALPEQPVIWDLYNAIRFLR